MALQIWLPLDNTIKNQGIFTEVPESSNINIKSINGVPMTYFDNSYIKFSTGGYFNKEFSFSFWIYVDSLSTYALWNWRDTAGGATAVFIIDNQFRLDDGGQCKFSYTIPTKTLLHVALTRDTNYCKLYINGELKQSIASTDFTLLTNKIASIGCSSTKSDFGLNYLSGYLRDYRVYNHCLSASEVVELSKGLYYHYPLNNAYINYTKNICPFKTWVVRESTWDSSTYNTTTVDLSSEGLPVKYGTKLNFIHNGASGTYEGFQALLGDVSISPNTIYTYSIYLKSTVDVLNCSQNILYIYGPGEGLWTDKSKYIYLGNGWYRLWATFNSGAKTIVNLCNYDYQRTGIYYFAAPQLEEGDVMTPYSDDYREADKIEYDCSGSINNIDLISGLTPEANQDTPKYLYSYNYNTAGNIISTTNHIKPTRNVSISAWVKAVSIESVTEPNVDVDGINIYVNNAGIIHLVGTFGDLNSSVSCIGTWCYVVGTYDGTTVKLYINGELKASKAYTSDLQYTKGAAISSDSKSGISCKVSDFRVYLSALTELEIKDMSNTKISNNGISLTSEFIE